MSSFQSKLDLQINSLIKDFCKKLSSHFDLSEDELYGVWKSDKIPELEDKKSPSKDKKEKVEEKKDSFDDEITREKIVSPSTTKDMLAAFCKKKGLKMSGKKEELIERLLESLVKKAEAPKPVKKSSEEAPVIKSIKEHVGEIAIRRNQYGNFEHMQTGLVFDTNKLVCGRQKSDGSVAELVVEDIEVCKKYKFSYRLPDNLNVNKNLDDIKIDEIDEEEELDQDDIEEEELEDEEELAGDDDI